MTQLDDLLAALEAWVRWSQFDDPHAEITDDVIQAYRAFKEAEPPLVLEECKTPTNKVSWAVNSDEVIRYEGRCYRLPTDE